jgi:hypothetical protein
MTRLLGLMAAQPYLLESKLFGPRRGAQARPGARTGGQTNADELLPAAR